VCNRRGLLVEGQIRVNADGGSENLLLIAQCHRCRRFVCAADGERLDPAGLSGHWLTRPFRRSAMRVVCCPFDPGVPLGTDGEPVASPLARLGLE
jgi:hypothetical protein